MASRRRAPFRGIYRVMKCNLAHQTRDPRIHLPMHPAKLTSRPRPCETTLQRPKNGIRAAAGKRPAATRGRIQAFRLGLQYPPSHPSHRTSVLYEAVILYRTACRNREDASWRRHANRARLYGAMAHVMPAAGPLGHATPHRYLVTLVFGSSWPSLNSWVPRLSIVCQYP